MRYKSDHTDIDVGDYVRCHYRRPWFGTVLEVIKRHETYPYRRTNIYLKVRQEKDARGNPIRKGMQKVVVYHVHYFERLSDDSR